MIERDFVLQYQSKFLIMIGLRYRVFPWICSSQAKTQNCCAIFGIFVFKRLSKWILNALKTKNPALRAGFLLVTLGVDKSNFYEDLEGLMELTLTV